MKSERRFFLIVLDSVGIGELPDADAYGDAGSHTLGNIVRKRGMLRLPHLMTLGLGHIEPVIPGLTADIRGEQAGCAPAACYGRMAEGSAGKDTVTGHWEIAGLVLEQAFPTFPRGFPEAFLETFAARIGRRWLGNITASGTEIIARLGDEHVRTGFPIIYTSADSVFQIAAHEEIIPLRELMAMCQTAREMLTGELCAARVIARPFTGVSGAYVRTANRRDFALAPLDETVLDKALAAGYSVLGIGKIADIFAGRGVGESWPSHSNREGMGLALKAVREAPEGVVMVNLVDFDMLYGHRNDVEGYARALEAFDRWLPELIEGLREKDVVMITADHGCDPTMPGTDHTREYVPLLVYGKRLRGGVNLGDRETFADVGQTVAEGLRLEPLSFGRSFWTRIDYEDCCGIIKGRG